jgi:hypothetical protein
LLAEFRQALSFPTYFPIASAEIFLAALIAEELARRRGAKPRLTVVVDNKS